MNLNFIKKSSKNKNIPATPETPDSGNKQPILSRKPNIIFLLMLVKIVYDGDINDTIFIDLLLLLPSIFSKMPAIKFLAMLIRLLLNVCGF